MNPMELKNLLKIFAFSIFDMASHCFVTINGCFRIINCEATFSVPSSKKQKIQMCWSVDRQLTCIFENQKTTRLVFFWRFANDSLGGCLKHARLQWNLEFFRTLFGWLSFNAKSHAKPLQSIFYESRKLSRFKWSPLSFSLCVASQLFVCWHFSMVIERIFSHLTALFPIHHLKCIQQIYACIRLNRTMLAHAVEQIWKKKIYSFLKATPVRRQRS